MNWNHVYGERLFRLKKMFVNLVPYLYIFLPLSPDSLVFNSEEMYSVNHILETLSSYRTYIQIIKYSSTQQYLLLQNLLYNNNNNIYLKSNIQCT